MQSITREELRANADTAQKNASTLSSTGPVCCALSCLLFYLHCPAICSIGTCVYGGLNSGEICTDRSNNVGLCPETAEYIADGICDTNISMGYNNLCKKLSQATKSNQITTLINQSFYESTTKEVRKDYLKYLSQINPYTHENKEAIEFLQKYLAEELMMLTIPDDLIAKIKPLCQELNKIQQNFVFTRTYELNKGLLKHIVFKL